MTPDLAAQRCGRARGPGTHQRHWRFPLGRKEMSRASLKLSGLLAGEAATAKCSVIHQIDKAHIAFIKRIMTGWCTGRLCLLAELFFYKKTPVVLLITKHTIHFLL